MRLAHGFFRQSTNEVITTIRRGPLVVHPWRPPPLLRIVGPPCPSSLPQDRGGRALRSVRSSQQRWIDSLGIRRALLLRRRPLLDAGFGRGAGGGSTGLGAGRS